MSSDDEGPEEDVSPEEKARAKSFGRLVDEMLRGSPAPPALDAEDRELLQAAAAIRAGERDARLDLRKKGSLIDAAIASAPRRGEVIPLPTRIALRRERPTWLPWAFTAAAALAALVFGIRASRSGPVVAAPAAPRLPSVVLSRSADELVGKIDRADDDRARARMDTIYADRLAGWRELRFGGPQ